MDVSPGEFTDPHVLEPAAIGVLIEALRRDGFTVIGPTVHGGAIVLDEITSIDDLPAGWTDVQDAGSYRLQRRDDDALFGYAVGPHSARRFLSPPHATRWTATNDDGNLRIRLPSEEARRFAFVGLRPCEVAALGVQDGVLRGGPAPDGSYGRNRDRSFVAAVECGTPASTCFCTSMGTGPGLADTTNADLVLTEVVGEDHRFVATAASASGAEVLAAVPSTDATAHDLEAARDVVDGAAAQITRRLDPHEARDVLAANLDHPRWDDVAQRCLSCTNCTLVCPTCFCTSHSDVTALDGSGADHVERWDSCFSLDHSYLHGGGSVRSDIAARYRQWLTHKLSTWWDQFDTSGCVGCGRCITWCPAGIDLIEEVAAIAGSSQQGDEP